MCTCTTVCSYNSLMVTGLWFKPLLRSLLCSWAGQFTLTVPLSTHLTSNLFFDYSWEYSGLEKLKFQLSLLISSSQIFPGPWPIGQVRTKRCLLGKSTRLRWPNNAFISPPVVIMWVESCLPLRVILLLLIFPPFSKPNFFHSNPIGIENITLKSV